MYDCRNDGRKETKNRCFGWVGNMEHSDSNDAADESIAGAGADNSETLTDSTTRPSAIERQIAAVSGLGYGNQTHREAADHTNDRYILDYNTHRRKPRRSGLAGFLVLFLLVATAVTLVFTDLGRPLQKAVSAVPAAGHVVRDNDSLPAANSSSVMNVSSATNPSPPSPPSPANATQTPASVSQTSINTSQTNASTNAAKVSSPDAISIPVADVSLRNRPELLEQLVQIYRSQLAHDPNDVAARTALSQLQERSLSELQTIVLEGDDATAVKSLEIISRLFPDMADSARYKYLVARTDRMRRQTQDEPAAKPENSTPSPSATSAAASSKTASSAAVPSAPISPAKNISTPTDSSATVVKKTAENAPSSKPEIRAVSITPGTMVENRFVPGDGGNVFMVEISYRNFDRAFVGKAEATLDTLLGVPGDDMVLAEVPVVIAADRGTKSFVMETSSVQGYAGGKFQLNFMLNDEFLTSRTVRLSRPGQ